MQPKSNYGIVASIIACLFAFLFGYLVEPIKNFGINNDASLVEYLNLIITLIGVIYIPFVVERTIKKRNLLRNYLVNDLNEIVNKTKELNELIDNCNNVKVTKKSDKSRILGLLRNIDNTNRAIKIQLNMVFNSKTIAIISNMDSMFNDLYESLTEGDLMKNDYIIDDEYLSLANTKCLKFISNYKMNIVKIVNL